MWIRMMAWAHVRYTLHNSNITCEFWIILYNVNTKVAQQGLVASTSSWLCFHFRWEYKGPIQRARRLVIATTSNATMLARDFNSQHLSQGKGCKNFSGSLCWTNERRAHMQKFHVSIHNTYHWEGLKRRFRCKTWILFQYDLTYGFWIIGFNSISWN
jgi:hypothetical protein